MKEGYIKQQDRKKILLIADEISAPSGVGNMAREIVTNTSHQLNWICIGGSISHPNSGKRVDYSEETNKRAKIQDSYVISYPTEGYGNPDLLRFLIDTEKPDAILLITDPRSFEWIFQMENEIRKKIPISYLNIWDEGPAPYYNGPAYASCDLLMSISKQTKLFNKLVLESEGVGYEDLDKNEYYPQDRSKKYPNKKPTLLSYIPHGVDSDIFSPLNETEWAWKDYMVYKANIFGGEEKDFVLLFNSRNIRRKQIPDAMLAFKLFLDSLPKEKANKCAFILHTEIMFEHGTDLMAVKDVLFKDYPNAIYFSPQKLPERELNYLYNIADAQILLSNNEGWGLSLTEAMLAGTPIIANVTGGMQDQMGFIDENGEWYENSPDIPSNHTGKYKKHGEWAFPVYPTNRSIQGSITTPYIWDSRCNAEDAAERIKEVYSLSRKKRKELGQKGREWAMSEKIGFTNKIMSQRVFDSLNKLFESWEPREKFSIINTNQSIKPNLNQKLVY